MDLLYTCLCRGLWFIGCCSVIRTHEYILQTYRVNLHLTSIYYRFNYNRNIHHRKYVVKQAGNCEVVVVFTYFFCHIVLQ